MLPMSRADAFGLLLAFIARLITGAQGHWKGCPPKAEQRINFANHQSHLDWVLIWAALPRELRATTRLIAARDYWTSSPLEKQTPGRPKCFSSPLGGRTPQGGGLGGALKRDAGVRFWGNTSSVTGAVGLLDRVAPLCFAAPVFFHSVRWYFQLKA